ncbi:DUF1120 domain-containing protein [Pseudomonas sp. S191]|uniref:DUF1120 domain-containing protein n=1 Tax=Pseudomonas sp. S191 TaxID=579575 RepID=UPI00387B886E
MKMLFPAVTAAVLLTAATGVSAASSVDLAVKGLITPSACTPNMSNGGVIDHGKIAAKDLKPDNPTVIGNHTLTLTISCDAALAFAFCSTDNRASGVQSYYRLGMLEGTQTLGAYLLWLEKPIADGVAVQTITSWDNTTWAKEDDWAPGYYMSVATIDGDNLPLPTKELVVDLHVQSIIYGTEDMDLSSEVTIDGSTTVEVKYL